MTVRPPAGPWSLTIQQLLGHLRDRGLRWAPEPLGVDEQGRDVVGYLPGVVPQYPLPGRDDLRSHVDLYRRDARRVAAHADRLGPRGA